MNQKKKIYLSLFLIFSFLLFFQFVSINAESVFFKGGISSLNLKENYFSGENISLRVGVFNNENFPITDSYIIIELVKGCKIPTYPSQDSNCDNVIKETVLPEISLAPNSNKKINFDYHFSKDLPSGNYRLDLYFRNTKTPIEGMAHIFLPGFYKSFFIKGSNEIQFSKILRTKTNIKNETGPIGVGVSPGKVVVLKTFVNSNLTFDGSLKIKLCDWQDSIHCKLFSEENQKISLIQGGNILKTNIKSPTKPGAYEISIELLNNQNELVSLYRSRLIVEGISSRIRKLYTDKYYYENSPAKVFVLLSGSPDHYTRPLAKNLDLEVTLTNNKNGETLSKNFKIKELKTGGFIREEADFYIKGKLNNFEVCANLSSLGKMYDSYCYKTLSSNFVSKKHSITLIQKFFDNSTYKGVLCVKDNYTGNGVETSLSILERTNGIPLSVINGKVNSGNDFCLPINLKIKNKSNYSLDVNDLSTNQEKVFYINKMNKKNPQNTSNVKNSSKSSKISEIVIGVLIILLVLFGIILIIKFIKGRIK